MIAALVGGIGLYLLGMVLLTDGLKTAAGDSLRRALGRVADGPLSGVVTGAVATALVQSSTATTVATIGFVSAGLLTVAQATGLIFGANIGTTSTGWIVAVLGLKFSIGLLASPLIGVGSLLRLLSRGRAASIGLALAGFGLIFVGIDTLQAGMDAFSDHMDPARLPGATPAGRLVLVAAGTVMTIIMQSSGAAVATTMTAVHASALDVEQAAALVIGQNLGSTFTAVLAAIGAAVPARRTALTHILFNVTTAVVAFFTFPLLVALSSSVGHLLGEGGEAASIAAFHTLLNVLGVAILLPLTGPFTALIARLVPERRNELTQHLDVSVASVGAVAIEAARRTAMEIAGVVLGLARRPLARLEAPRVPEREIDALVAALAEVRSFLAELRSSPEHGDEYARHVAVLHAVDHLDSLVAALKEARHARLFVHHPELRELADDLVLGLDPVQAWLEGRDGGHAPVERARTLSEATAESRRRGRSAVLERTARGGITPDDALAYLDALNWIDRIGYHTWRTVHYLGGNGPAAAMEAPDSLASPVPASPVPEPVLENTP